MVFSHTAWRLCVGTAPAERLRRSTLPELNYPHGRNQSCPSIPAMESGGDSTFCPNSPSIAIQVSVSTTRTSDHGSVMSSGGDSEYTGKGFSDASELSETEKYNELSKVGYCIEIGLP